ncbi:MAG TPA: cob(I)yrinic acid a,c-diamide adenosyltransferase [Bacillus bacterium]|uniref:Corrinoid adenosyltransferase n=1 Tax=Siminovitchia fordii TaxID=254759 RepID=A0ABQ4KE85_9BACI|nr:cob(I)yrinic acid a,c-diamide adenosyltransferase [Siminovitchia fordii]GIN23188.1 ATP--cob(I)alamin adenosyltransferase [Siminovitchia fordii]HBZ11254.1 cob(I)yrinic acid a,c-diamide adenosyltransferase [Bacillus sp. (in: firmicutes)]
MRIYTRTGDKGMTSLVYGTRIPKNDMRVEAYGTCDEANSTIGLALSFLLNEKEAEIIEVKKAFHRIQTVLFHVGAELATPEGKEVKWKLTEEDIKDLEKIIDRWDQELPSLKNFILPGGHPAGAAFHAARTVVRRAERCAVAIGNTNPLVLSYLNRLSDLLFVAARYVNTKLAAPEYTLHEN